MDINLTRIISGRERAELSGAIRKFMSPEMVVTVGGVPVRVLPLGQGPRPRLVPLFRGGNRCAAVGVYET
jgi:hypothetical protein